MATTTIDRLLAKADALEQQASALRLAASFLTEEAQLEKRGQLGRTLSGAIALRVKQRRNGHEPEVDRPEPEALGAWAATQARRDQKREQVLAIIGAYGKAHAGKPMPIAELKAKARAQGIRSLTGMISYVRAGLLSKSGQRGKTRYRLVQQPEQR